MVRPFVRAGADWLALREPADAAARSPELVEALRRHLPADGLVVHDLGCGTGSLARWLAPRLGGPQHWVLHDRDEELLAHAASAPPVGSLSGDPVSVETRLDDITRLAPPELSDASAVTASALLDMFTEEELRRFVAVCLVARCPVLVTLSVVGRVQLQPGHPLDAPLMAAFNEHQRRHTARGRLLGPSAASVAVSAFQRSGHRVLVRPSTWHLGRADSALASAWFTGWVDAASEQEPILAEAVPDYAERRRAQLDSGVLRVAVHHVDLLALPR